jgi:HSP20 family protein
MVFKTQRPGPEPRQRPSYRKIELRVERFYAPFKAVPWMQFRKHSGNVTVNRSWMAVDVVERGDVLEVTADLPGVDVNQLKISLVNNVLLMQGEKTRPAFELTDRVFRRERPHGTFSRDIVLPISSDLASITAEYSDGVLNVRVRKIENKT